MKSASYSEEFPLLEGVGLYASDISGDGNCLFHALSDQLYGHEKNHVEIRERVVEHMRTHAEYFKLFLDAGTARRAPKRKAATSTNKVIAGPTEDAIDKAFAQHLKRMSQSGVYGDNMEISAFARDYNCDVKIYQREFAYVVSGGDGIPGSRKIMHIAYHTWEHYSSIRNCKGPHTGLPNVTPAPLTEESRKEQERKLADTSYVLPWMVGVVASSLPYIADPAKIHQALEKCKGNVGEAVSQLFDGDEEVPQEPTEGKDISSLSTPKVIGEDAGVKADSKDKKEKEKDEGPKDEVREGKSTKKQTARQTRASARIKAKEDDKLKSAVSGSGLENSGSANEEPPKQSVQKPKREIDREKKSKRKESAKARKREKNVSKKDEETEGCTATITSGIKELYV